MGPVVSCWVYVKFIWLKVKNKQIDKQRTIHLLDYSGVEINLIMFNLSTMFCQIAFLYANTALVVSVFYIRNSEYDCKIFLFTMCHMLRNETVSPLGLWKWLLLLLLIIVVILGAENNGLGWFWFHEVKQEGEGSSSISKVFLSMHEDLSSIPSTKVQKCWA